MTTETTASIGFGHPDLDSGGRTGLSINMVGHVRTVSGADAIRQSLLMLISTRPGERVMRPGYGCPLHRLVFAPQDATTAGLAIHFVEQAIRRWEPRVDLLAVDAGPSPTDETWLLITVDYRIRSSMVNDSITVEIDLGGNL